MGVFFHESASIRAMSGGQNPPVQLIGLRPMDTRKEFMYPPKVENMLWKITAVTIVATPNGIRNIAENTALPLKGFDNRLAIRKAAINWTVSAMTVTSKVFTMGL